MKIIGHRGAMGLEPENTLRSFKKALEIGVDMVEFDVYALKTGELVVIHDEDVDRTTNGHGKVINFSFEEIRKLNAGKHERIPTVQEVLDTINKRVPVNIELKGPNTAHAVAETIKEYLAAGWQTVDFIVSSFMHDEVRKFKASSPSIDIAILMNTEQWQGLHKNPKKAVQIAESAGASALNPDLKFVNPELVNEAHKTGINVNVFTLVENNDVFAMKEMGVDGIFCNFPDRAKEVLRG